MSDLFKSTVLCARTLEVVHLTDVNCLDELQQLQIQQDAKAMRGLLGHQWCHALSVSDRWVALHWGERFIGAIAIQESDNLSLCHLHLIGRNIQVSRAVCIATVLHENFKGRRCAVDVPVESNFQYMRNFLRNLGFVRMSEDWQRNCARYSPVEFLEYFKYVRTFFTVPSTQPQKEYT